MGIFSEIKNAIDLKDRFCNYYKKRRNSKVENDKNINKIKTVNKVMSNNTIKRFEDYVKILEVNNIDIRKNPITSKRNELIINNIISLINSIKNKEDTVDLEENISNLIKLNYDDINMYFKQNLQNSSNNMVW